MAAGGGQRRSPFSTRRTAYEIDDGGWSDHYTAMDLPWAEMFIEASSGSRNPVEGLQPFTELSRQAMNLTLV